MPSADDLAAARYARMRWNAPLSEEHAALLLDRLREDGVLGFCYAVLGR